MIAVGLCVDRDYFIPALTTLVSIADSHDGRTRRNMSVRILSTDMSRSEASVFESIVLRLGFGSFDYRRILPPKNIQMVHGKDYISSATYLRFFFDADFLGKPYLLYLDADTLVMGDVTEPFNDLSRDAVGAVEDEILHTVGFGPALPGLVDLWPRYAGRSYFNAGAMWAPTGVLESMRAGIASALRYSEHIHFNDQDALNLWFLCARTCQAVGSRFNRFELGREREQSDWVDGVIKPITSNSEPRMLHFIGPLKPWLRRTPGVSAVRLYSTALNSTRSLLSRVRCGTMDLNTG